MPGPLPASPCRVCGHKLDAATIPGSNAQPRAGDISVCIYCATVSVFTPELTRRALTAEEVAIVASDPRLSRMVSAVRRRILREN